MTGVMTVAEFREWVKAHDANKVTHERMEAGEFKEAFSIICKKCGSQNVEFFGEAGVDYGGMTGYAGGENGFKCLDCGAAITWFQ